MSHVRHKAIVVTSFDKVRVEEARALALRMQLICTDIIVSEINAFYSFMIGPDGSKTGSAVELSSMARRQAWRDTLDTTVDPESGSPYVDYVEVHYGEDVDEDGEHEGYFHSEVAYDSYQLIKEE